MKNIKLLVLVIIFIGTALLGIFAGRLMVLSDIEDCAVKDATQDNSGFVHCVNRLGS